MSPDESEDREFLDAIPVYDSTDSGAGTVTDSSSLASPPTFRYVSEVGSRRLRCLMLAEDRACRSKETILSYLTRNVMLSWPELNLNRFVFSTKHVANCGRSGQAISQRNARRF